MLPIKALLGRFRTAPAATSPAAVQVMETGEVQRLKASLADHEETFTILAEAADEMKGSVSAASAAFNDSVMPVVRGLEQQNRDQSELSRYAVELVTELGAQMHQIGVGANEQHRMIHIGQERFFSMSESVSEVSHQAEEVSRLSQEAQAAAQRGGEQVRRTTQQMTELQLTITTAAEAIAQLGTLSERIGHVILAVEKIAGQTNLLALNAAIEAARAGERGLGFAVVADEVRKLSDMTARSSREIAALVQAIDAGVRSSAQVMDQATRSAERSLGEARQAGSALDQIERAVGETARHASLIDKRSTLLAEDAAALGDIIQGTAAIATQTAGGIGGLNDRGARLLEMTRENSQAAGAQTEQLQQVARTLQNFVGDLSQSVQMFDELAGMLRSK